MSIEESPNYASEPEEGQEKKLDKKDKGGQAHEQQPLPQQQKKKNKKAR